jgi:hypothetical protein
MKWVAVVSSAGVPYNLLGDGRLVSRGSALNATSPRPIERRGVLFNLILPERKRSYTDALSRVTRTEVRNAAGAIVRETYPGRFEPTLTVYNSFQDVATYPKDGPLLTRPSS